MHLASSCMKQFLPTSYGHVNSPQYLPINAVSAFHSWRPGGLCSRHYALFLFNWHEVAFAPHDWRNWSRPGGFGLFWSHLKLVFWQQHCVCMPRDCRLSRLSKAISNSLPGVPVPLKKSLKSAHSRVLGVKDLTHNARCALGVVRAPAGNVTMPSCDWRKELQ